MLFYVCSICKEKFKTKPSIIDHLKKTHKVPHNYVYKFMDKTYTEENIFKEAEEMFSNKKDKGLIFMK